MSIVDLLAIVSSLLSAGAAFGSVCSRLKALEAQAATTTKTLEEINVRLTLVTQHYTPLSLRPN